MQRKLFIAYLALAHIAGIGLLYVLFENRSAILYGGETRQEVFQRKLAQHYVRRDRNVEPGAVLFLGASTVLGMDVSRITDRSVNFGIGGETMVQLANRASSYRSLQTASAVVIWAGYNDLRRSPIEDAAAAANQLVTAVPEGIPVLLVGVQPVRENGSSRRHKNSGNSEIDALNAAYAKICQTSDRCTYIDSKKHFESTPTCHRDTLYERDGLHLSVSAYDCMKQVLKFALNP